jgi:ABC-2 type transport system permease protein
VSALFPLFLRRLLFAKRTFFFAAIAALPILGAGAFATFRPRGIDALQLLREFLAPLTLSTGVLIAMFFGTTAFGDEIEGKTIAYLLVRPRRRSTILLAKIAAVATASAVLLGAGIVGAGAILRRMDPFAEQAALRTAASVAAILAAGSLAYGSAFTFLGLSVRHPVVTGLVLSSLWEGFVGTFPGDLRVFTLQRYLLALLARACDLRDRVLGGIPLESDPPGDVHCLLVLLGTTVGFTMLGDRVLRRRDFH